MDIHLSPLETYHLCLKKDNLIERKVLCFPCHQNKKNKKTRSEEIFKSMTLASLQAVFKPMTLTILQGALKSISPCTKYKEK